MALTYEQIFGKWNMERRDGFDVGDMTQLKGFEMELAINPMLARLSDENGMTALAYACHRGNLKVIEALIPHSNLSPELPGGRSLLHYASCGCEERAARATKLILPHCDARAVDRDGDQALILAINHDRLDVIGLLLPHSDLSLKNNDGQTPLELAIYKGRSECQALIEKFIAQKEADEISNVIGFGAPAKRAMGGRL